MALYYDIAGLIAVLFGLYALAAGLGGLFAPERWTRMMREVKASAALAFLIGIFVFALGALVMLAIPPGGDWLATAIFVLGALMALEGLVWLAAPGLMAAMGAAMLGGATRFWALLSILIAFAFLYLGAARLFALPPFPPLA